jgi:hypothetical protein
MNIRRAPQPTHTQIRILLVPISHTNLDLARIKWIILALHIIDISQGILHEQFSRLSGYIAGGKT